MSFEDSKRSWEERLKEHSAQLEEDVRGVIDYIHDEVLPDVRRQGSHALRLAAVQLEKLAERMDEHKAEGDRKDKGGTRS